MTQASICPRTWTSPRRRGLVREIDQEARRRGVTRQASIKIRIADSLQQE
jgi:hypothetical protein